MTAQASRDLEGIPFGKRGGGGKVDDSNQDFKKKRGSP